MSITTLFRDHINIRDLGGYQAVDGRRIKSGLIYRSGGVYLMNPDEIETLRSLGIKYIMDLRTSYESNIDPDPILDGIDMVRHSGLVFRGGEEIDFSPVGMSKVGKEGEAQLAALIDYYSGMPFDNEAFRILMEKLKSNEVPILFHCATGKDRTGVAAMIILAALGIPRETILNDYMLSNYYHRETINRILSENKERFEEHPILEELLSMRTGVTEKIGLSVLDSMYSHYGSIEAYLEKEFGLDEDSLRSFRDNYLLP